MKILDQETIDRIKSNYPDNWIDAMIGNPEKIDEILSFLDRNKEVELRYEQVFFSPDGFDVYELDGEKRMFCVKNSVFPTVPLSEADAKGDWQAWLAKARKVKELR